MFRPMRRFKQQLPEEDVLHLLEDRPRGVLAVLGDEDYPYTVPMDFVYDPADHTLNFHTAKEGHKLDSIRKHPKASFCVIDEGVPDETGDFFYFNSVIIFGRMSEITDPAEKVAKLRLLGNKYFPTAVMTEEEIAKNGARVGMLKLTIEHITGKHVHER
ncbi:MAG: pyridoxamine 5'-phosphate oxidase family protein [Clostridiales bacterium]|nr:pyridoxamine 5'-phosphate oxidase family protein [Clostridiales bacterium]